MTRIILSFFFVLFSFSGFAQQSLEDNTKGVVAIEQDGFLEPSKEIPLNNDSSVVQQGDLNEDSFLNLSQDSDQNRADNLGDYPNISILFTYWEYSALGDAIRIRSMDGFARAPTESELAADLARFKEEDRIKPPPEERYIRLGGIVYNSKDDWTIWLNEKRVKPNALPEEVINLRVYEDYIELYWLDQWSNNIYPIRLRPHQRFNIDTRIFLPG